MTKCLSSWDCFVDKQSVTYALSICHNHLLLIIIDQTLLATLWAELAVLASSDRFCGSCGLKVVVVSSGGVVSSS